MIKETTKYKSIISQINYFSLLLFVFWLPLKDDYLPVIIAIWIVTWLMEGSLKERFTKISYKYLFIGLTVYFFFNVIFLYKANYLDYGLFKIQEQLSIIFFPIILAGSDNKIKENYTTILKAFIFGNLVASFSCILYNLNETLYFANGKYFLKYYTFDYFKDLSFIETIKIRYNYFSGLYLSIFKHHAYFSMYISFAILIIVDLFRKKLIKKTLNKVLYSLAIMFFAVMLFLLQSRSAFVAIPVVIIAIGIIKFSKKINLISTLVFIVILGISIFGISTSERLKKNLKELQALQEDGLVSNLKGRDVRYRLWYTSTLVIKDNFWFGTSPANLTDELVKKYEELGFDNAKKHELNSHNQYLETFAGMGVFGFLALMYVIIYSFIISIRERNYLLFFLMLLLSINFLFESMLNRMAGVLFMMFFLSMFTFMEAKTRTKSK